MTADTFSDRTLEVAERVATVLAAHGADCALIGAAALAVHGYPRATDLDLATAVDPFSTLRAVAGALRAEGLGVELIEPDAADPLGGVLTVTGSGFEPVQVVNYLNPLRGAANPGAEAVRDAQPARIAGTSLRVITLPHLVALKLYAGGRKSELDVLEVLERNPDADVAELYRVCERYGLRARLDEVLAALGPVG